MEADYIIVGAGSAGCATAFRLCEAGHRVIVLEYGGSDRSPLIQMPGALSYPMNMPKYDWGFFAQARIQADWFRQGCCRQRTTNEYLPQETKAYPQEIQRFPAH